MAFNPAAWQASSAAGGAKPATVRPQSCILCSTAGSFGTPSHAMMGKNWAGSAAAAGSPPNANAAKSSTRRVVIKVVRSAVGIVKEMSIIGRWPGAMPAAFACVYPVKMAGICSRAILGRLRHRQRAARVG